MIETRVIHVYARSGDEIIRWCDSHKWSDEDPMDLRPSVTWSRERAPMTPVTCLVCLHDVDEHQHILVLWDERGAGP